MVFAEIFKSL